MKAALLASTSIFAILWPGWLLSPQGQLIEQRLRLPYQLQNIAGDIRRAISAKLYYPALVVALTIPDICIGLTLDDEVFVRDKQYIEFVETYAKGKVDDKEIGTSVNGLDCYRLRCGMIHRGNAAGHPHLDAKHVIFTTPDTEFRMHGINLVVGEQTAVTLDLGVFCEAMIRAMETWYADNHTSPKVIENVPRMLSQRHGVKPFLGGTVIASDK